MPWHGDTADPDQGGRAGVAGPPRARRLLPAPAGLGGGAGRAGGGAADHARRRSGVRAVVPVRTPTRCRRRVDGHHPLRPMSHPGVAPTGSSAAPGPITGVRLSAPHLGPYDPGRRRRRVLPQGRSDSGDAAVGPIIRARCRSSAVRTASPPHSDRSSVGCAGGSSPPPPAEAVPRAVIRSPAPAPAPTRLAPPGPRRPSSGRARGRFRRPESGGGSRAGGWVVRRRVSGRGSGGGRTASGNRRRGCPSVEGSGPGPVRDARGAARPPGRRARCGAGGSRGSSRPC